MGAWLFYEKQDNSHLYKNKCFMLRAHLALLSARLPGNFSPGIQPAGEEKNYRDLLGSPNSGDQATHRETPISRLSYLLRTSRQLCGASLTITTCRPDSNTAEGSLSC